MQLRIMAVLLVALVVATLAGPQVASARELKQGTFQLSGQSSALFENSTIDVDGEEVSDVDTFNIEMTGLYHVIDNLGLGVYGSYENTDFDDGVEVSSFAIGPVIQYSIPMSQMANLRFAATGGYASAEVDNGDDYDADGFFWGGSVAVALFPTDYVSVDLGVRYLMTDGETDDTDLDLEQEDVAGFVGLSVYF